MCFATLNSKDGFPNCQEKEKDCDTNCVYDNDCVCDDNCVYDVNCVCEVNCECDDVIGRRGDERREE